jgi:hypothetical protein
MEKAELLAALASLSADERAAILGGASPGKGSSDTPKFSVALDQVADGDIAEVVNACRAGLKAIAAAEGPAAIAQAESDAYAAVAKVAPVVASAAQTNSNYRRKPFAHSLAVAVTYLQSEQADAKRAAKRRKVPAAKPAAAAPAGSK